jgi:hypothetical protein
MTRLLLVCAVFALAMFAPVQAAAQSNLDGRWHFVLDTPGGDRETDAVFKVDGDQVSGKWDKENVNGSFTDSELELNFEITPEETSEKGTLVVKGRLEGDTITGTWDFGEYKGTFKATRK